MNISLKSRMLVAHWNRRRGKVVNCRYYMDHLKLTDMQVKIMSILRSSYPNYDGMDTSDLLEDLYNKFGKSKRAWQGSLKGLGKKGYVTYGNVHNSCDGGVCFLEKSYDYFDNFKVKNL